MSADLALGAGYRLFPSLEFNARHLFDLNDLNKTKETTARCSLFQFSLGYVFGAGKEALVENSAPDRS